ncbi:RDD family protein [Candidatus Halobeggiatoa sp. HSG11]|nr:RDD family protein [Candidatus Halobeggiatoa sp. HSG11]
MNNSQYPSQEPLVNVEYSGFWLRLLALIIDIVVLNIILFILIILISVGLTVISDIIVMPKLPLEIIGQFLVFAFYWLYFTVSESSVWQATIGKNAMGMVVTDIYGNRISFLQANIRYWSKILSTIFMIGFIMAAFTEKKQGLHDMIAGTLVVKVY